MKPAVFTQDELEQRRKSDRVLFLRLFRDMCLAHYRNGLSLIEVVEYIDQTIAEIEQRERAA